MSRILVLGSSGLIGSALTKHLRNIGHTIKEWDIKNTAAEDLTRISNWSKMYDEVRNADFVYFLAFDVGGSKYLEEKQRDFWFIHNNTKMMVNVFDALEISGTPFVFASSMMANMNWSMYGQLKSLGEAYTNGLKGISARFWNVYDAEPYSKKSHVIADFCHQASTKGEIKMISTGEEVRNFIHVNDACKALEEIRANRYIANQSIIDVASDKWHTIGEVALRVSKEFDNCPVVPGTKVDEVQLDSKIEPNRSCLQALGWEPEVSLEEGIKMVAKEYQ